MTRCSECDFEYESVDLKELSTVLRGFAGRYRAVLDQVEQPVGSVRPHPDVWSAIEYTCHVRDVLLVQRDRLIRALVEEGPVFARMHRDERSALCAYASESINQVLDQVDMASDLIATVFDHVQEADWLRTVLYNWPSSQEQDIAWLGRHTIHECEHHLLDLQSVLQRVEKAQ